MPAFVIPTIRVTSKDVLEHWADAFGMELVASYGDGDAIHHAELRRGDGWLMAATPRAGDEHHPGDATLYWVLDADADVDAVHAQAVAHGAQSLRAPQDEDYGGRGCTLADRDGNRWSFGSYRPGAA